MKQIKYKNGTPVYERTEEEVEVKNIFNKEDEAMFAHLLKKTMGLTDEEELPDGMKETPHRLAKYWTEAFASGYMVDPKRHLKKLFDVERGNEAQVGINPSNYFNTGIVVCKFKLFSQCEHHIAPFGTYKDDSWAYVAYIPKQKVVGLSKIPRMAREYAHRFQIQEQLGEQIADAIQEVLDPIGVAVVFKDFTHSCVVTRGVKSEDATTTSSVVRGAFADKPEARAELFSLIH
jgi:GTP cyclohydrolase I